MTPDDAAWQLVSELVAPREVIWSDQNAPRPAKPYFTLMWIHSNPPDHAVRRGIDEDGNEEVARTQATPLRVMAYGPGAHSLILDLSLRLGFYTTGDRATALGLGLGRQLGVNNVPALVENDSQREERALLDFEVIWTNTAIDPVGRIEQVVIEGSTSGTVTDEFCVGVITSP